MIDFKKCTDEELVAHSKAATPFAVDELLNRYKVVVNLIVRRYFIVGYDVEDLAQEGFMALLRAVLTFEEGKNASFKTYACRCINSKIIDIIRTTSSLKHKAPEDIIYIDGFEGDGYFPDKTGQGDPEGRFIENESYKTLLKKINAALSADEVSILNLFLEGISYSDIASTLDISTKKVDNSLQKIKKTLKKTINS